MLLNDMEMSGPVFHNLRDDEENKHKASPVLPTDVLIKLEGVLKTKTPKGPKNKDPLTLISLYTFVYLFSP